MKAIIQNDDFGLTYGFTEAIKDSFLKGVVTSTSIRTNGLAFKYTKSLLKKKLKKIGLGIHLNLVDGKSHTKPLANKTGLYKYNFFQYLILSYFSKNTLRNIENELDYQFSKVKKEDLKVDHVSGHNHTYAIPPIFEIVCKLAKKYHIKCIRLPSEPYYLTNSITKNLEPLLNTNFLKFLILNLFSYKNRKLLKKYHLKTTDAFYGILYTGNMNLQTITAAINNASKSHFKSIEILGHSAYVNDQKDKIYTSLCVRNYVRTRERGIETETFKSKQIMKLLSEKKISAAKYSDLISY